MRHLRQTHLGSTITKCLTIVDLALSPRAAETSLKILPPSQQLGALVSPRKTYILQLPNELLGVIMESVAQSSDEWYERLDSDKARLCNNRSLKALSRVCRRFSQIAQPLLFRTIRFKQSSETVPPSTSVQKLHRTLKENPRFQEYCR